MTSPSVQWIDRHRRLVIAAFLLVLAVALGESALLYRQSMVIKAGRVRSDGLRATFLGGDTAQAAGGPGVHVRLQNVRLKWSDRVYIDAGNMALRAVPVQGATVNFDDPGSYHLVVQQSAVLIRPDVLAGMLNESVFNYHESRVQDLEVSIVTDERGARRVRVNGKLEVLVWIPFAMVAQLSVDTKTNTLVIAVENLKVFGIIPATRLIRWAPLHLDRLIELPPNKSVLVDENRIMVKPFALFPPPRVDGTIVGVEVGANTIGITFAGDAIPAPESTARNYVYLRGGTSQIGRFRMVDTDVLILDQDQSNPFVFSLLHYGEMIPRSRVELPDTRSARITMPDFEAVHGH